VILPRRDGARWWRYWRRRHERQGGAGPNSAIGSPAPSALAFGSARVSFRRDCSWPSPEHEWPRAKVACRCRIRLQPIGDRRLRCHTLLLEQLPHQVAGCGLVPAALDQHVQDLAFVIDRRHRYSRSPAIHTPFCRGASTSSTWAGGAAGCERWQGQTSRPSAGPFHRTPQGRARRAGPPHRGS
jgi:hypothetical protein